MIKENTVFCEECMEDVKYTVKEKEMSGTIRGTLYSYFGKEAKCALCGADVYVELISEENLKALYDVYRKKNYIISLEKIREIPKRYAIGKRPLSVLLGWGEQTYTRYVDGDIPIRQYSDILNRLYDDPNYYLSILKENKDRLGSNHTYKKSLKVAESLIVYNNDIGEKIKDVSEYILNQCGDITPLALQKSLYYIQGFFYAFFGRFIFEEDCEAWAHGPVYRKIYDMYADYHFNPISKVDSFDYSIFSAQEKAVIDSVIKNICCYSGKILEMFTHSESPWINTRGNLPEGASSDNVIDKQMIADFFVKIKEKYSMNTPRDIQLYTKDMFINL